MRHLKKRVINIASSRIARTLFARIINKASL